MCRHRTSVSFQKNKAVEHMAQANWSGREQAAKMWLCRVMSGDTSKSLDQIQEEVNNE